MRLRRDDVPHDAALSSFLALSVLNARIAFGLCMAKAKYHWDNGNADDYREASYGASAVAEVLSEGLL